MKAFDAAIRRLVVPRLAALGFSRRRTTWNRGNDRWTEVINFQQSAYNSMLDSRFTVNLALTLKTWVGADVFVLHQDCFYSERIGRLRTEREDYWYRFDPGDQVATDAVIAEALADVEALGLPFLVSDLARLRCEANPPPPGWKTQRTSRS